jgi:radical SAM/Cys-rich protein
VDIDKIRLAKPVRKVWVPPPAAAGSLIPDTLAEMENDAEFQLSAKALRESGQKKLTLEERKKRRRALVDIGIPSFSEFLAQQPTPPNMKSLEVTRRSAEILQLNIGLYCNQACNHCHVESSPQRTETMDRSVAERCLQLLAESPSVHTLDITGGAPELNAQFRYLVEGARALETTTTAKRDKPLDIIDRCNLTVLVEPGQEDLVDFLAKNKVRVATSLPCYSAKNVNAQRGNQVFERSLQGLAKLNEAGYGKPGTGLELDLVYNPSGGFLPPPQAALEDKYKEELLEHFGVRFNALFTMTNMVTVMGGGGDAVAFMVECLTNYPSRPTTSHQSTFSIYHDQQFRFSVHFSLSLCGAPRPLLIFLAGSLWLRTAAVFFPLCLFFLFFPTADQTVRRLFAPPRRACGLHGAAGA